LVQRREVTPSGIACTSAPLAGEDDSVLIAPHTGKSMQKIASGAEAMTSHRAPSPLADSTTGLKVPQRSAAPLRVRRRRLLRLTSRRHVP